MAIGIICEYNPFHKGHAYHIQTTRELTEDAPIICVMSGHYVQRGEPALLDKWSRTRMALAAGASLVIELPTYYSSATAEWFAWGAVSLLQHTGLIDTISFGLEAPQQLPALHALAGHLSPESPQYRSLLQQHLQTQPSFAAAREKALHTLAGQPLDLQSPNTILVLEYLKSMRRADWSPSLLPIQRVSAGYHDLSTDALYPSASAIRLAAQNGRPIQPYLPDCCLLYASAPPVFPEDLFAPLPYALCFHTPETLTHIDEVGEGLENRIYSLARESASYTQLLNRLKTKRYPTSRLRRILLNILLRITSERKETLQFTSGPQYIRVLGFRRNQISLLSQLTKAADLPVITNLPRQIDTLPEPARSMLQDEIRFSEIYAASGQSLTRDCEYRQPLIIL